MSDLKDHLEALHELDGLRTRAKELREMGLRSLRGIENIREVSGDPAVVARAGEKNYYEEPQWICSGNKAEVALLVKLQNHHNLWERDEDNDRARASDSLAAGLDGITLDELFPEPDPHTRDPDATVPLLVAARSLQALTARPETVFSKAAMLCYYRIIREFYYAAAPDWTIGAARAGSGGLTSAFVTSECIRAVFAFESAIRRTAEYFAHTRNFYKRYLQLRGMLASAGLDAEAEHPLRVWADKAVERMWLDWFISTNPRQGAIALSSGDDTDDLLPLPPRVVEPREVNMDSVGAAFATLGARIADAVERSVDGADAARLEIEERRWAEPDSRKKERTESAFHRAHRVIVNIQISAALARAAYRAAAAAPDPLAALLDAMHEQFKVLPDEIHRVLEPSKRYVRTVVDHELGVALSGKEFDAGELIFAATALGAATNWRESERLRQACDALVRVLSDTGRFVTSRPFHSTSRGYKLLPIGCEMTRSFAKLLHRTRHEFEPKVAARMLNIFAGDNFLPSRRGRGEPRAGWNFENSPDAGRPCVWVTAISVQALDRIVRMLNDRINEMVFKHFKVIRPEKPHSDLDLNRLIYPDYGLSHYYRRPAKGTTGPPAEGAARGVTSVAIRLEQMRAHVMRASLPRRYKEDGEGNRRKVSSAILYGPPGTGKTSLLEALALSSNVPLVMLSPSDLIVQGQEHLEGRARAVFDALSMLSQVVILLDEFEPILRRRAPKPAGDAATEAGLGVLMDVARAIREGGASMLKFLVTGMLPKLVSLHDAAERQSLVYCLATNHLEEIDDAAKRGGRFDVRQPVYNPDPLSRAGTFLFRLQPVARDMKLDHLLTGVHARKVLADIVVATANENAGELSRRFYKLPKRDDEGKFTLTGDDRKRSFFAYALGVGADTAEAFEGRVGAMTEKNFEVMKREHDAARERLDALDDEMLERRWLFDFEQALRELHASGDPGDFLRTYLTLDDRAT